MSVPMRALLHAALLAAVTATVGCAYTDPYTAPGHWHPLGANAANLRAMVADPADLYAGRGATAAPGDIGAAAVARLRDDAVKRLPASSIADVHTADTGEQPGANPGAPTAAAPVAAAPAAQ